MFWYVPFAGASPPEAAFSKAFFASPGRPVRMTLAVMVNGRSAASSWDSGMASATADEEGDCGGGGEAIDEGERGGMNAA